MPEEDGLMNENEIHFMFSCTAYDNIRDILFSQMSSICDNFFCLNEYENLDT